MKAVLDSSALVALLNARDALHAEALAVRDAIDQSGCELLLPYEIYAETLNVIGRSLGRLESVNVGQQLLALHDEKELTLVRSEPHVLRRALDVQRVATGAPSFADCLVMAFADEHGTKYVFGFDATFRKNGFRLPESGARRRAA